jgi:hypothetical protein
LSLAAAVCLALLGAGRATAQPIAGYAPPVTYYYQPVVSYYYTPVVSYAPTALVSYYTPPPSYYTPAVSYYAPAVSYYRPAVSYYYAPAVSYYAGSGAVTTTRYGLFGRPRVSTTYYYP